MKNIIQSIGVLLAIVKLSTASDILLNDQYFSNNNQKDEPHIEYYANFSDMYQDIRLFHDLKNNSNKITVKRDTLGKVLSIYWRIESDSIQIWQRNFEYNDDGLLSILIDKIDNKLIIERLYGANAIGEIFLDYKFSKGFIPRKYNYYTEVFYHNYLPSEYKIISMNGHIIGKISKEYDSKGHLIREIWSGGKTNKILREFTSKFNSANGHYELLEKDSNGEIISHIITLSSIN